MIFLICLRSLDVRSSWRCTLYIVESTKTEKKFLLGTKSVDFQLTLQTISQLLIQKYISSHFKSFPIGKDRERDKVSLGRIGSIYPRQRANLVTINLNNQSTNNQLVPPTLARHLHSLPEKKISFFLEISWRKEVHVWSYPLWTNRICLFAKQTLLQHAFNQNTIMLTLNDEKDDGKFMETGETLVEYC